MKIAIVGDGKVGFALACQLNQEGHDVTIIENKQKVLEDTVNRLDISVSWAMVPVLGCFGGSRCKRV